jgi:glucose-1-phosphate thymidylyltransferase
MVRKAVVMAGGLATRLRPLTTSINKHMLPVYDRPIIQHVVENTVASGVTDILMLLNHSFAQPVMELLEDGEKFGCSILYGYQKEVVSVGKHIANARQFIGDEPFLLMLGDSWFRVPLRLSDIGTPNLWVMPLTDGFDDFRKYPKVTLSRDSRVTDIIEKPSVQKTGLIQTGAFVFPPDVFDRSARLVRSVEGEVQVRTIVSEYVTEGRMHATLLPPQSFLDLGTVEALYLGNSLERERRNKQAAAE